jgi:hypothetical protein
MRKIFAAVMFVTSAFFSEAQVYIQTTLPTVGLVQKNQLWNLVLVNSTTASMEGKLGLVLRDRQTGIDLMTATTNLFTLPKGSLSVNVNTLNPVQYNYLAMDATGALNNLLPAGAYIACYSFTRIAGEKQEQIGEECVPFDIEPLSPPMLIFPADSSELDAIPAQFTWTPPTPAGMINRLRYEVLITEILPGQKADEAVQNNMSFYSTADIATNFLTYPASLPGFEKEKWYGWQVVARDDKSYAGKSEVWVFKVKNPGKADLIIKGTPFMKMKPDGAELGIAPNGILKLSYDNRSSDSVVTVTISDLSAERSGRKLPQFQVKVVPGENQIQYPLKKIMNLSEESTYEARIVNSVGEKSIVLFRVKYFND